MKTKTKIILFGFSAPLVFYLAAFYILGFLAPKNQSINRFYSKAFYDLRCLVEKDYIDRLETHEGIYMISSGGNPAIVKEGQGKSIGFVIHPKAQGQLDLIQPGTKVRGQIGKRLDRESIGLYHNELRAIEVLIDPEKGA